jgi:hypothetical protein
MHAKIIGNIVEEGLRPSPTEKKSGGNPPL